MVHAINGANRIDPITAPIAALEQTPQVADPRIALFETSQAIFERNCYKCHGATKQKGGYRLDEQHSINLGGKSKLPAIVPGNVEQSELMYRMLLPHDDDDAMPPEEKDTVSPQDIDLVRQWIEAGAYWPDEAELSAAASDTVKLGDADTDQLIEQISRTGVKAEYNAWGDESIRIDLGVVGPGQLNQAIQQLSGFRNKLTWLDCSELALSSDFFQQLEQCIKLQRLHLNGTDVTDKQLDALSQLADLNYLNLYNTQISDAGLESLHASSSLRKIFLSQTQVTANGITELKKSLPELEVVHQP
jgi:mono/diheme cytochrome c family protein